VDPGGLSGGEVNFLAPTEAPRGARHWRLTLPEIVESWWKSRRADLVLDAAAVVAGFHGVTIGDRDEVDYILTKLERAASKCGACDGTGSIDGESDDSCDLCRGDGRERTRDGKVYQVALVRLSGRGLGRVVCPCCWRDHDPAFGECVCGVEWREDLTAALAASLADAAE
jgi:hypothetical protein